MSLSEYLDLAYRSVIEMPDEVWLPLVTMVTVTLAIFLFGRFSRSRSHARLGLLTRGHCSECSYHPDTGTKVCPECGSPVLDMRLFRPVARQDDAPNE